MNNKNLKNKIIISLITILFIVALGYGIYYLIIQAKKPRPGIEYANQGQDHINLGASHPAYNSNPPTSGWHYGQPAVLDIYQTELPDEQLIHNLEHGNIWISYKPDISPETKANLEALAKTYSWSVILTPRSANDTPIALASWRQLQKLETFDKKTIVDFIRANKNKSPESVTR